MNAPLGKDTLRETVKIAANGRMVLPKSMRDAIGIDGEAELELTIKEGQIYISTFKDRVRRAQELYRKHAKRPRSSDEFLATRERD